MLAVPLELHRDRIEESQMYHSRRSFELAASAIGIYLFLGAAFAAAGIFSFAPEYATAKYSTSVVIGDFNKDGIPDLAVACRIANTLSILLGAGHGKFQSHVDYATGNSPVEVAQGDFDNDGKLDLVLANEDSNTVSVLLGKGDGTFQTHVDFATASFP